LISFYDERLAEAESIYNAVSMRAE
jgi:hypothetical protein